LSSDAPAPAVLATVTFAKSCVSPVMVTDPYTCQFSIGNSAGNTLRVSSLVDVVHAAGGDVTSVNILPILQLVFTGSVACSNGSGAGTTANPNHSATSCLIPSGASIHTVAFSQYDVQAADYGLPSHLLSDGASLTWNDTCTPDASGCATTDQTATASASALVELLSASTITAIHDAAHSTVAAVEPNAVVPDFVTVSGPAGKPTPTGNVVVDRFANGASPGHRSGPPVPSTRTGASMRVAAHLQ